MFVIFLLVCRWLIIKFIIELVWFELSIFKLIYWIFWIFGIFGFFFYKVIDV